MFFIEYFAVKLTHIPAIDVNVNIEDDDDDNDDNTDDNDDDDDPKKK